MKLYNNHYRLLYIKTLFCFSYLCVFEVNSSSQCEICCYYYVLCHLLHWKVNEATQRFCRVLPKYELYLFFYICVLILLVVWHLPDLGFSLSKNVNLLLLQLLLACSISVYTVFTVVVLLIF